MILNSLYLLHFPEDVKNEEELCSYLRMRRAQWLIILRSAGRSFIGSFSYKVVLLKIQGIISCHYFPEI